jgi:hypothetical protein
MYRGMMKRLGYTLLGTVALATLPISARAEPYKVSCQATVSLAQGESLTYEVTGVMGETTATETPINPIGHSLSVSILRRDRNGTITALLSNALLRNYDAIAPDADYSQIPFTEAFRAQPNDGRRLYVAPASVHGLSASLRPISAQPQKMQIVHYLSASQSVRSAPGSCLAAISSPESLIEPPLQVIDGDPLPLLTVAERQKIIEEGNNSIQSWINLAGVGATSPPTEFTEALQATYQQQQTLNPYTATFLGVWQGEPPASGYSYYLSIFPANEANQVCIVEYQRGQQIDLEPEPATFTLSKATVMQDNLLSPRLRSSLTASQVRPFYNGTARFLTVQQHSANNRVRVFSLTDRSALYDGFSPRMLQELSQATSELGCVQ